MKPLQDALGRELHTARSQIHDLFVLEPFFGLGGFTELLHQTNCNFDFRGWDCGIDDKVYCGDEEGDVRRVALNDLPNATVVAGGPSCKPWAGNGDRLGVCHEQAELYETAVSWVIEEGQRGCLYMFLLENSPNILKKETVMCDGIAREPFGPRMLQWVEAALPHFQCELKVQALAPTLPHSRVRCWLRGMRKDILYFQSLPAALTNLPAVPLAALLDPTLPATDPERLRGQQLK